jgi:hypothetical protein
MVAAAVAGSSELRAQAATLGDNAVRTVITATACVCRGGGAGTQHGLFRAGDAPLISVIIGGLPSRIDGTEVADRFEKSWKNLLGSHVAWYRRFGKLDMVRRRAQAAIFLQER